MCFICFMCLWAGYGVTPCGGRGYTLRGMGYALRGMGYAPALQAGERAPLGLRDSGDWSHAPAVRDSAWRKSEIARSACAFAKRARLPQAEDSATMRVSRDFSP